jgi:hypothetical protein
MEMVAPLFIVSVTFAGGLGRFDLSVVCAFTELTINKQQLKIASEKKYFMVIFLVVKDNHRKEKFESKII